jgi:hypothetical protein
MELHKQNWIDIKKEKKDREKKIQMLMRARAV